MREIQYEIVKEIAVLSKGDSGYTKEINLISWNGREPKYDIRSFSPNREKCGKGITLNADEAAALLEALDKILVSEREKLTDGMVRQEIKIYYKFIGFVGELHITPTKRWTALKPKNCTVCGVEYVPRSGISKYCPACAKKIQREKSNESKRRSRERNRQACIELSAKNDRLILPRERGVSSARATRIPLFMCTAM